jgi:hypothetical protein
LQTVLFIEGEGSDVLWRGQVRQELTPIPPASRLKVPKGQLRHWKLEAPDDEFVELSGLEKKPGLHSQADMSDAPSRLLEKDGQERQDATLWAPRVGL